MSAVDSVRDLVALARKLGYEIREEWLGGAGCSVCELRGKPVVFIDAACSAQEQAEQLREALRNRPDSVPATWTAAGAWPDFGRVDRP